MHSRHPQMGCSSQMGYYHKGLGAMVYDEPGQMGHAYMPQMGQLTQQGGQMGSTMGADPLSSLWDVVQGQIPGLTQNVFGQWLQTTKEGQQFQQQAQAVGAQMAASQLAAQDASYRQSLQNYYNQMIQKAQANYKTWLMWIAGAAVLGVAAWYILPRIMAPARATAANPRYRRNAPRRRKARRSRRRN